VVLQVIRTKRKKRKESQDFIREELTEGKWEKEKRMEWQGEVMGN